MPQSYSSLNTHIIFGTKDRAEMIGADLQPRLHEYIGGIFRDEGCHLLAAGGMPDHIHLLVSLSRELSVAETMRIVKASSSRWIHETFPARAGFAWQSGYAAFAVSLSNLASVKRYIDGQAEHHRTRSYKEELIEFLKRHEIAYDERYLCE
ncbi:MAG: IS200/IS605 family transposase [Tepidisphaeraceae bacterium]|jgi:REP element-mobilizing transposase RayT